MMLPQQPTKKILYDSYCPSVQSKLEGRTCNCNRYYSSIASMKSHLKNNKICKKLGKLIKPMKIIGARTGEKLVVINYEIEEDVEWVYDIDIETDEVFVEPDEPLNRQCSIRDVLTPIWEDSQ